MGSGTLETLAYGYGLIEGPRVDVDGTLYFSDVPNGGVRALSPDGEVSVVIPKRRGVGGIAIHADGGLVVGGRNICHVVDGETRVIFDSDSLGFNDLITDARGRVVCGTIRTDPFDEDAERTPGEAYRIALDGTIEEMYGGVGLTNGIGFSPDGSTIYHSDTGNNHVICHDVEDDRYVNRRALAESKDFNPDGLAVDEAGTIWVADYGAGCVRGFDPTGVETAKIDIPARAVTSLCFGGDDRRDLFIVTADNTEDRSRAGTIFRTRADVPGVPVALARV
ncbi:MAG: SMP-30/gluconolactonase/LRE family protein [Acidimicrobiia bacterium]|nr:SMP-30/gluconolactonase/LRE family protein [Acidimicrobiia bacterium]